MNRNLQDLLDEVDELDTDLQERLTGAISAALDEAHYEATKEQEHLMGIIEELDEQYRAARREVYELQATLDEMGE